MCQFASVWFLTPGFTQCPFSQVFGFWLENNSRWNHTIFLSEQALSCSSLELIGLSQQVWLWSILHNSFPFGTIVVCVITHTYTCIFKHYIMWKYAYALIFCYVLLPQRETNCKAWAEVTPGMTALLHTNRKVFQRKNTIIKWNSVNCLYAFLFCRCLSSSIWGTQKSYLPIDSCRASLWITLSPCQHSLTCLWHPWQLIPFIKNQDTI